MEEIFLLGSKKNAPERLAYYRKIGGKRIQKDRYKAITKDLLGNTESDPRYPVVVF